MKKFAVSVDITMSSTIYVKAENEEAAKNKVTNWIGDDPYYYVKRADAYVSHEFTDVSETDEEIEDEDE